MSALYKYVLFKVINAIVTVAVFFGANEQQALDTTAHWVVALGLY